MYKVGLHSSNRGHRTRPSGPNNTPHAPHSPKINNNKPHDLGHNKNLRPAHINAHPDSNNHIPDPNQIPSPQDPNQIPLPPPLSDYDYPFPPPPGILNTAEIHQIY